LPDRTFFIQISGIAAFNLLIDGTVNYWSILTQAFPNSFLIWSSILWDSICKSSYSFNLASTKDCVCFRLVTFRSL